MIRRTGSFLLLAAAFIALSGDNCVMENKNVEIPLRGDVTMQFTSQGDTDSDTYIIDFGQELMDIENDSDADIDTLVSAAIEGAYWKLALNRGAPGTSVSGSIQIRRVSTNETAILIPPTNVPNIDDVTEFEAAPLQAAGVQLLKDGFDEYVDYRNGLAPFPDLQYQFTWNSSGSPPPVDFDWEAKLAYTIVGVFSVDVPDL